MTALTDKWRRLEEAAGRQAERVTEGRTGLSGEDVEDLLLLATQLPSFGGWCDLRTVADLARRALYAEETAPRLEEIARHTEDPLYRARLRTYAQGLRDFA